MFCVFICYHFNLSTMTTMWMALMVKQTGILAHSFPGSGETLLPKTYLTCPILSLDVLTLLYTIYFA